jgi:asparagine synthase (glutamine-hydrolysing)
VLDFVRDGGWRLQRHNATRVWIRGYLEGNTSAGLARRLAALSGADPLDETAEALKGARGHFALVAATPNCVVAAVDWVRSIPLYFAEGGGAWRIDDRPERLRRAAHIGDGAIDDDAALSLAMAGYTIDRATLYRGLGMLGPGECAVFRPHTPPAIRRYYAYRPWRVAAASDGQALRRRLQELTLDVVRRMIASLGDRMLVIPLSAGFDSRLIASACRHLGYGNVRCFAYGRAGNFEAATSRAIAERLGYAWQFVPYTITRQRRFFEGAQHASYLAYADSCASVPFEQDLPALVALKDSGFIPGDAVIANGNSGDYVSGMHIPAALHEIPRDLDADARKRRIVGALSYKHFSLWRHLCGSKNKQRIEALLWRSIEAAGGALGDPETDHGLYEYAEFQDRQCKYVITGQRAYEFLGHDWRLPLWDNAYLEFWEAVPLRLKAQQALYSRMLTEADWGGVWRGIAVNAKTIRPRWIAPLRLIAKGAMAPAGREAWHRFERRFLQYWMDVTCSSAVVPYRVAARDRRGARHAVAWFAERYLAAKGIRLDQFAT